MGTAGGGGGGPGGKSFPKCARRAWVGCHRLVYFCTWEEMGGGGGGEQMLFYPCLGSFFGRAVCTTPGPVGVSGRECRPTVLLWFGVKTKQEASVFRRRIHMRGRTSRVLQPQFCLMFFFSSTSVSWYVCRALLRKAFFPWR